MNASRYEMISKELLSEVFGTKVVEVLDKHKKDYVFFISDDKEFNHSYSPYPPNISIYELAHKCKEWAYKLQYELSSGYKMYGLQFKESDKVYCDCRYTESGSLQLMRFYSDIEQQAIINACQWILDNKEIKQ